MCDGCASCVPLQGTFAEAERLYQRCQAIEEKVLGPEHPDLASTLHDRANVLRSQVQASATSSLSCIVTWDTAGGVLLMWLRICCGRRSTEIVISTKLTRGSCEPSRSGTVASALHTDWASTAEGGGAVGRSSRRRCRSDR